MAKAKIKDFEKPKYKVGKKVEKPNESKLNFKAKRVNLAPQSILIAEPSTPDAIVTECLTRCRHYSARKRLDAFHDLRKMPTWPSSLLFSIISTSFGALTDDDADVRKISRLFILQLLSKTEPTLISPFSDVITLNLRSGLSHVDPPVRKDAVDLLRSIIATLEPEYLVQLLRRRSASELVQLLCEQKLRLDILDVITALCQHLILPRASHADQWRISALLQPQEDDTANVIGVLVRELNRLRNTFEKPPKPVDALLSLLGEEPAAPVFEKRKEVKNMQSSRNRTGGSFAALLEDF